VPTLLVAILADQLLIDHPALIHAQTLAPKTDIQVVLVESHARLQLRPYQRHKLVLVLSALRHYAAALRAMGWQVSLRTADSWRAGLTDACAQINPDSIVTMAGAEYNARRAQERWSSWLGRPVVVLPNRQFLAADVPAAPGAKRQTMEAFYRSMRTRYQLLL
jgi:deoxyribodipyrimidine photolyase-related protein